MRDAEAALLRHEHAHRRARRDLRGDDVGKVHLARAPLGHELRDGLGERFEDRRAGIPTCSSRRTRRRATAGATLPTSN